MFRVECMACGGLENECVRVEKARKASAKTMPRSTVSKRVRTTFRCERCDIEEEIATGVLPASKATSFRKVRASKEDRLTVAVSGTEIEFVGVDESYNQDANYTANGVQGTSTVYHVHIHAYDPPTISKGVHHVRVGGFIDEEMRLGDIRYHDDTERTLKFYKVLDEGGPEPIGPTPPAGVSIGRNP